MLLRKAYAYRQLAEERRFRVKPSERLLVMDVRFETFLLARDAAKPDCTTVTSVSICRSYTVEARNESTQLARVTSSISMLHFPTRRMSLSAMSFRPSSIIGDRLACGGALSLGCTQVNDQIQLNLA